MVPETPNLLDQLLPDRHPQVEGPFYVLSKKLAHDGRWIGVISSSGFGFDLHDYLPHCHGGGSRR